MVQAMAWSLGRRAGLFQFQNAIRIRHIAGAEAAICGTRAAMIASGMQALAIRFKSVTQKVPRAGPHGEQPPL